MIRTETLERPLAWYSQLVRFLLVGLVNTGVGLGTIWLLIWTAGWSDMPANAAGYAVGLTCSFLLNRRWTFASDTPWWPALRRFLTVFVVAYSANLLAVVVLRDAGQVNRYLAHALATVPYTIVFFIGSRCFAFRHVARASA
jgi:putative flippase GtrA